MGKATCSGWELLPHEVDESEITMVGSTKLCKDCYQRFDRDPMKSEYSKYL